MTIHLLSRELIFPPPESATEEGLIAVGGDFSPERLLLAYGQGIFPWPAQGYPLLWFSPDPRFVLEVKKAHLSRSLRKVVRQGRFDVRFDSAFDDVMQFCASTYRPGQGGTWITDELMQGYTRLFEKGYAHSVEAYLDEELVGGLYGVSLGRVFFGESMFSLVDNASKVAFATLLAHMKRWGMPLVDCQVHTDHLERFGGVHWDRRRFLQTLGELLSHPTRQGPWKAELSTSEFAALGMPAARSLNPPRLE